MSKRECPFPPNELLLHHVTVDTVDVEVAIFPFIVCFFLFSLFKLLNLITVYAIPLKMPPLFTNITVSSIITFGGSPKNIQIP